MAEKSLSPPPGIFKSKDHAELLAEDFNKLLSQANARLHHQFEKEKAAAKQSDKNRKLKTKARQIYNDAFDKLAAFSESEGFEKSLELSRLVANHGHRDSHRGLMAVLSAFFAVNGGFEKYECSEHSKGAIQLYAVYQAGFVDGSLLGMRHKNT